MPLPIQPPAPPRVATQIKIGEYTVNPDDGWYRMTLRYLDADGVEVTRATCQGPLFKPDGSPRFSPQLYADSRDTLYALGIEDEFIVPAADV